MASNDLKTAEQILAANLKEEKEAQGVTNVELAGEVGVSDKQIGKYLNGDNSINAMALKAIADKLGRPVDEFFKEPFIPSILLDRLVRDEKALMYWYRQLPEAEKEKLLELAMRKAQKNKM